LHWFFDCKYLYGLLFCVLVLTQHLNGKYSVSSCKSDERHISENYGIFFSFIFREE
jgi:hypothetical protein